jgi:subtilisin family serine protease
LGLVKGLIATTGVLALTAAVFPAPAAAAAVSQPGRVLAATAPGAIKDQYVVVLKDSTLQAGGVATAARGLAARFGGTVRAQYSSAVRGFAIRMPEAAARALAAHPAIASVEQDRTVVVSGTQSNPTWGLDRIDQRTLPLSGGYTYPNTADTVTTYVLDTGVRNSHSEFGGRARSGYDFIDNDTDANDCNGHGTHVAGTIAGATYGVAKQAKIVGVRVLNCEGSGSYSGIIAGVDWVTKNAVKPAVANMSLGGSASSSVNTAVRNSIAAGISYVLAAGNSNVDACTQSPASVTAAITVGASDAGDYRASFSNYGTCLDVFAPGVRVLSAAHGGDTGTTTMSGTSMAAPHAAGAAALYLHTNPTATPAQVHDAMTGSATTAMILNPGTGSPNRLLYATATTAPAPTACTVTNGTDLAIGDRSTVESKIVVGCGSAAAKTSTITVRIKHTDRGDLALWLIAPDGSSYKLKNATSGDNVANLVAIYTRDLSTENRNGTWKLRISDSYRGDTGFLDTWTLTL